MNIHVTITHEPEQDILLPYLAKADLFEIEARGWSAGEAQCSARGIALHVIGQWQDPPMKITFSIEGP